MKKKIREFNTIIHLLTKVDQSVNDKLTYAVKKVFKSYQSSVEPHREKMNEAISDFNVDHCNVDSTGSIIITGEGANARYSFSKENKILSDKNVKDETNKFLDTEIEIQPYLIDDIELAYKKAIEIFDDFDREELIGILFK